jgi:hypothetical protein
MTEMTPMSPWWRKKRWRIAVALWFAFPALYMLSTGPVNYMQARRWLPVGGPISRAYWFPISWCFDLRVPVIGEPCFYYLLWWVHLAEKHNRPPAPTPKELEAVSREINRTHWTPPSSDGNNRNHWTPKQAAPVEP